MKLKIDDENLDEILDIVDENESLIIHNYKGKEDQILFPKELVDKFYYIIENIAKNKENIKEILKLIIREALELNTSDIVVSKNGDFFIKLFDNTKRKPVTEERRYDGIDEDSLKSFYEEFFSEEDNAVLFLKVAREYVSIYLHEMKITNEQYERDVFKNIQTIIQRHLVSKYDKCNDFFHGFSGYIFRKHFNKVFEHIADVILKELANSNPHINKFINYYSINVLVLDGKKYKVPSIETSDGLKWNTTSILLIAKKYFQTNDEKRILLQEIEHLQKETSALHINGISPLQYQTNITKKIQELNLNLNTHTNDLDKHLDSLYSAKNDDEKKKLKAKTVHLKNLIQDLGKQKKEMDAKVLKDSILKNYNKHKKNLEEKSKELKNKEAIANKNKNLYLPMRNALVKALISKKRVI